MSTATATATATATLADNLRALGELADMILEDEWERIQWEAHIRVQGEIEGLEQALRAAGCPDICTLDQAARALTATQQDPTDADAKNWIEEQIKRGYLPALNRGRWPWSPKTIRLDHLARRVVEAFYNH